MYASHSQVIQHCKYGGLLTVLCVAFASSANAQSARSQVFSTIAFGGSLVRTQLPSGCAELYSDSTSRTDSRVALDVADSLDASDDSIDPAAGLPGSGMVLVDSHGRTIAPPKAAAGAQRLAPTPCCPDVKLSGDGVVADLRLFGVQTVSSGSSARARCADAMNPPPSSRSPL